MQALFRRLLTVTVIFSFFIFSASAQSEQAEALNKLYNDYPQEKIYAWFNKPEYVAGETAWFKIYIFSGYELSGISANVYVELYNAEKKVITSQLLPVFEGIAQGSIELSDKLAEDVYYIRIYTRWMMNFDPSFQYIHLLPVFNPSSSGKLVPKKQEWAAKAFAEGGWLIDGIKTKMAVRLFSSSALPEKWSGYLIEEGKPGIRIAEFISLDKNVASFFFTPDAAKKYTAVITDNTGTTQNAALPDIKKAGIALQVEHNTDSIICRLIFKNIPATGQSYRLIGQMQNELIYQADFKHSATVVKLPLPTKEFYNGILHLTLFDEGKNAIAERLVFVNPEKLFFDSTVLGNYYFSSAPRGNSSLEITVDSLNWGTYALSVTDADVPSAINSENLLSSLWLTSDLSNPVQDAAKYFDGQNKNATAGLDALLITETWKRFRWDDILNNRFTTLRYLPHHYLSYSGTVRRNNNLLAAEEINLIFYSPDSSMRLMTVKTDNSGTLHFDNLAFEGNLKVFYQANSKKTNAKNIDISLERDNKPFAYTLSFPESKYFLQSRSKTDSVATWVSRSMTTIKNEKTVNDQYKTLEEVVLRSKLKSAKQKLDDELSSGMFKSFGDIVFDFVNEDHNAVGYTNILQWLDGKVAGLSFRIENGTYVPYIRGSQAAIYLDEMPYSADGLNGISANDIAMVKVIKGPIAGGWGGGGAGGTIAIYTRRGNMRQAKTEPALNNTVIRGYDTEKKFILPDYNDKSIRQPDTDHRDQLVWSSLLLPDESLTKSKIKFVNNDSPKRFRVIVQGFTEKGLPVFFEKIIEVPVKAF